MIEGIKLDFDAAELKSHMETRAKFHEEKAEWYAKQIASLKEGRAESRNVTNDPISSLENSASSHRAKSQLFRILAAHVIDGEKYRLSDAELERLELVSRY